MLDLQTDILYLRVALPFTPYSTQVLYVEDFYDAEINDYLRRNFQKICENMRGVNYRFCYLPYISQEIASQEIISYFTPYQHAAVNPALDSSCLTPFLKRGCKFNHSLLVYDSHLSSGRYHAFHTVRLDEYTNNLDELFESFVSYLSRIQNPWDGRMACSTSLIVSPDDVGDDYADMTFTDEVSDLIAEVREKIDRLRKYGVDKMVLRSLLNPEVRLSVMRITHDGRIFLPGYDNMEIKMSPLVKAVYFLFLRHEEGIVFKTLPDYRAELYQIYSSLTGRGSDDAIKQSIYDVTDPCKNSINEKCARIREAFVREFDDQLARYYYVTGLRGMAKGVSLPRTCVHSEFGRRKIPIRFVNE